MGVLRDRMGANEDRFLATVFHGSGLLFLAITFASSAIAGGFMIAYETIPGKLMDFGVSGSGKLMNLFEVAREIAHRLARIFLRDESDRRPVYGGTEKFQTDPHWKDCLLFFEYFHGDNGAGIGASHQTGWTGLVRKLIEVFGRLDGQKLLETGRAGAFASEHTEEFAAVTR
jgi:hypothetical protein